MRDKPHKFGAEALTELRCLSNDSRLHILGLFEQHTEGLIILAIQLLLVMGIIGGFPGLIGNGRGFIMAALIVYVGFSVFWVVRSIYRIRREIYESFTKQQLLESGTYGRYCEGGWFFRTIGGLLLATIALALAVWLE